MGQDPGHGGEGKHVVDDGRLAEQALQSRDRRLRPNDGPVALQALQQRGLLAADIGTGPQPDLELEGLARAEHGGAQNPGIARLQNRPLQRLMGVRIFRAQIDVALGRADRDRGDRHALDQQEGIAFHQHPVGEGAAIALVGIADDVFLFRPGVVDGLPFDSGREAGAAAAAQAGFPDLLDDLSAGERQRFFQTLQPVMSAVIGERERVGHADALEGQALLALQPVELAHRAEPQLVSAASLEAGFEQRGDILRHDRAIGDAPLRRLDLDHRLEPEHAARAVADDLDGGAARLRFPGDGLRHRLGTDREGGGVDRHEDADRRAHCGTPHSAAMRSASTRPSSSPSTRAEGPSAQLPRQ